MAFDVAAALLQKGKERKKKRYILFLFSKDEQSTRDFATMKRAAEAVLPDFINLHIDDPNEALNVLLIKVIDLVVVDSAFLGTDEQLIAYAVEMKKRKKSPILFVTREERSLIEQYREHLHLYEELDDYISSPCDFVECGKRMKRMVATQGRAAKRFSVNAPASIFRLNQEKWVEGTLQDVSLVGFSFLCAVQNIFDRGEQIRVKIRLGDFSSFNAEYGDFIRLAGRVQRVSIDGKLIGCSFEYITPMQMEMLTKILDRVARRKRVAGAKGKSIKPPDPNALPKLTDPRAKT